jgi:hypothetical protein
MYCLLILLKKATLSLDDGLHLASEGHSGLGRHCLVHGGKVLLNGGDQGGLGSVGTSVSTYVSPRSPTQNQDCWEASSPERPGHRNGP